MSAACSRGGSDHPARLGQARRHIGDTQQDVAVEHGTRAVGAPGRQDGASLPETRRFPSVLYLAPSPAERFKALTQAVVELYPDYPPYDGEFAVADLTPHLTIADRLEAAQLDNFEREFMQLHGAQLPVKAQAQEVALIDNTSGRWETRARFKLAAYQ